MQDELVARVRARLFSDLESGKGSLARVSRALGIGARTLQRRLKQSGVSFQGLRDDVRRERFAQLAKARRGVQSLDATALALGYSDVRSLRRWRRSAVARVALAGKGERS